MVSPITGMITIMMTAPSVMNVAVLGRCGMRRINAGLATETPSCTICDSISSIFSAVRRAISRALNPLVDSGDGAAYCL